MAFSLALGAAAAGAVASQATAALPTCAWAPYQLALPVAFKVLAAGAAASLLHGANGPFAPFGPFPRSWKQRSPWISTTYWLCSSLKHSAPLARLLCLLPLAFCICPLPFGVCPLPFARKIRLERHADTALRKDVRTEQTRASAA